MRKHRAHVLITFSYAILLYFVYLHEISPRWGYLGFPPVESNPSIVLSIAAIGTSAFTLGNKTDTRTALLALVHYLYLVPSLVFLGAINNSGAENFAAVLIFYTLISVVSRAHVPPFVLLNLPKFAFLILVSTLFSLAVFLIAIYGGLERFNLSLFSVYDFRREASENMPEIFGYIFSSISKAVTPVALLLAIYFRSVVFSVISIVMMIILFGMTHHKSVLFLALGSIALFWFLLRNQRSAAVGYLFLAVISLSVLELGALSLMGGSGYGLFTSYIVRRGIFFPPLLDSFYLDFFQENVKLYWSSSRFGLGLFENPYGRSAPFLIGSEYFGNVETSANTGIVGSGYSHAGLWGIALYSTICGLLLALFQSYGRLFGHALVSAASFSVFASMVVSTDLTTAILSHGLLLLILLFAVFPNAASRTKKSLGQHDVGTFHNRSLTHRYSHSLKTSNDLID